MLLEYSKQKSIDDMATLEASHGFPLDLFRYVQNSIRNEDHINASSVMLEVDRCYYDIMYT
jgi:hypothetical protein